MPAKGKPNLIPRLEAARRQDVSARTIDRKIAEGKLVKHKADGNNKVFIDADALAELFRVTPVRRRRA